MLSESEIAAAAYLFEWALTKQIDQYELSVITEAGLQDADPAQIATLMRDSLENSTELDAGYRGGCFWALGKRCDSELRDFFQHHLAIELNQDMGVAYQIMIALENLGESIWTDYRLRGGLLDEELNREAALQYLKNKG